ncbi:MAG: hypothetical protein ACTSVM_04420 [Candidatus Ranarchaeia archaeon]
MGIKGRIAWNFMTEKVSQKLLSSMYEYIFSKTIETTTEPDKINNELRTVGEFMGKRLLADYAERIREHAVEFPDFASTLKLAYKINVGHEPSSIIYDKETDTIRISDTDCIFCREVTLPPEFKDVHFCEVVSGVFQAVLDLRGFKGHVEQVEGKATGDQKCTWVLKRIPE